MATQLPTDPPQEAVYGKGSGRNLRLDLFLPPEEKGNGAGVVFIHGGGWRGGTRTQFHPQSRHLASAGFVCACIEYRFSDEANFPAALADAKCAMRWMRAHREELGVHEDRICVSGGSAGGHLAGMVAMTGAGTFEGDGGWAEQSSAANLAVLFNPACDLGSMVRQGFAADIVTQFVGEPYAEAPEAYDEASPITYVSADSPPALLLHGAADTIVPYADSQAFVARMRECGAHADLFTADGAPHGFFNSEPWYTPTLGALQAFLEALAVG